MTAAVVDAWLRRARPLLGTIVEVGARGDHPAADAAVRAAFDAIADVQARLSRFEPTSEIARFHAIPSGTSMAIGNRAIALVSVAQILHDEHAGGVRPFPTLRDGPFRAGHFDRDSRSTAWARAANPVRAHASVAAPACFWADALTKVIAISGDTAHPLLARCGAQGWLH